MPRVSRDVAVDDVGDLLDGSHRACLAVATLEGPVVMPVDLVAEDGRYRVGLRELAGTVEPDAEVVVLVDDGVQWFDLRAIHVRGVARPVDAPDGGSGRVWLDVAPTKVVPWDYGALREVDDDPR